MAYPNRKYLIINYSDVTDEMINSSIAHSKDHLRKSITGTDKPGGTQPGPDQPGTS